MRNHFIEGIHDSGNPAVNRNIYTLESVRVARSIVAFVVMAPSGGSTDEASSEGLKLRSVYPWTDSHSAGMGLALDF